MKKLFFLASVLLMSLGANASPFSWSFSNPDYYSCDHYSIEMSQFGDRPGYVAAGTFFDNVLGIRIMHIFRMDQLGGVVWEKYIPLGTTDARALDVCIGPEFAVALTGYVDDGSGAQLYAALFDPTGTLMNDFWYSSSTNSTGNNIIYSATNDQYVIGGFENVGTTLNGNALMVALDAGFNFQWDNSFNSMCDGFDMAVINEIVEVNEHYLITGNLSAAAAPYPYGQSQILLAIVDNATGLMHTNASFQATTSAGQQAMGISAHYNAVEEELVLMYNVSISPTTDENRPYFNIYNISGVDINYVKSYRFDDNFVANPTGFVSNPNFTGLKLLRNRADDTYVVYGMVEAYGPVNDEVVSVWQEVDLNTGTVVGPAKLWTPSNIATGYPAHGGFYSLFDPATLSTKVYTPETTCRSVDNQHFVSILPTPDTTISYDVISSALPTADEISGCIEDFELELVPHEIIDLLCLDEAAPGGSYSAPGYTESMYTSTVVDGCVIIMAPTVGVSEYANMDDNTLSLLANPVNEILRFTIAETGLYNVMITTIDGQVIALDQLQSNADQQNVDVSQLAPGMYLLVAMDVNGNKIQKRFVKR